MPRTGRQFGEGGGSERGPNIKNLAKELLAKHCVLEEITQQNYLDKAIAAENGLNMIGRFIGYTFRIYINNAGNQDGSFYVEAFSDDQKVEGFTIGLGSNRNEALRDALLRLSEHDIEDIRR